MARRRRHITIIRQGGRGVRIPEWVFKVGLTALGVSLLTGVSWATWVTKGIYSISLLADKLDLIIQLMERGQ